MKITLPAFFISREGQIAAYCVIALMGLLILKNLGGLVYSFKSEVIPQPILETYHSTKAVSGQDIVKWHLFGEAPGGPDANNLPKSLLNVTLVGIFSATPVNKAMVAIRFADGREKIYVVGEIISDGVSIYKILPDRVVIKRGNRYEILMLPDDKLKFEPPERPLNFER